jgi:CheY-like chemotaxis protein
MPRSWPASTTVLLVEDDHLTSLFLSARLQLEGLRVLKAHNGKEAMEFIKKDRVDIVSADLIMPVMDGYRLIREIRQQPAPQRDLPILVLSVNQNEEDIVRCLSAGADDYMTKPFSAQVYVEKLWRIYHRTREAGPWSH